MIFNILFSKNSLFQLFSTIVVSAISFFLTILIARNFSYQEFTLYSYGVSLGSIFLVLYDGGFKQLLLRERSHPSIHLKKFRSTLFDISISNSLLVFLFIFLFFVFTDNPIFYFLIALCFLLLSIIQFISYNLKGMGLFILDSNFLIYSRVLSAVPISILVICGFSKALLVFFVWLLALIIIILSYLFFMHNRQFKFNLSFGLYKFTIPFVLIDFFTAIYFRSDLIMMKHLNLSYVNIANYAASFKIIEIFNIIFFPISILLFRRIRKKIFILSARNYLICILILLFVGFVASYFINIYGRYILNFFFGNSYINSDDYLSILSYALIFIIPNMFLTQLTLALNCEWFYVLVTFFIAAFNLLFNFLYLPSYGPIAASYISISTEIFIFLLLSLFISSKIKK
jgi:O-antigen/teichoic acid export membrane protein